jgi:hypothetical protein
MGLEISRPAPELTEEAGRPEYEDMELGEDKDLMARMICHLMPDQCVVDNSVKVR